MEDDRLKELIAIARKQRATTKLATAAGTTKMALSRWARGEGRPPTRAHLRGMSRWAVANVPGVDSADAAFAWLDGNTAACPALTLSGTDASAVGGLRRLRLRNGLTQGAAATAAGVSRATWISWEARDDRGSLDPARRARAGEAIGNVSRIPDLRR